ncbi:MAG: BrxA/BrxB family bacilliredoxin [Planctomycetes bacterium]|nr:BrxA/BrxB family bacilliredoxin [Planctomycetota bacterium]
MQSLYDLDAVKPLREELPKVGVRELLTPAAVDAVLGKKTGTVLVVVNSVCGCAAGSARPAVMLALQYQVIPDELTTVFAGVDREATERARGYFAPYPPSSPSIALLKDGKVAAMVQRQDIEGRSPEQVARELMDAFNQHCTRPGPSIPKEEFEKIAPVRMCGSSIPNFRG